MADIMLMGKNPNYIGAYDLYDLDVKEITVTIKNFREEEVVTNGKSEACAVMYFEEDFKPMIVNPTNKKVLAKRFHSKLTEKMVGKRITIHIEQVKAFGKIYDALRIKDVLPRNVSAKKYYCADCGGEIAPAHSMTAEQMSAYTSKKYGRALCEACAVKENQNKNKGEVNNENNENQD